MFDFSSLNVSQLLLLNGLEHLCLLALENFSLLEAILFTLLDLVNNDGSSSALGLHAQLLSLVLHLKGLQTLDFHHQVQALLLLNPLLLQGLVLLKLLVSDGDDLGVKSHLIHVLNIVMLLIELLLGLLEETVGTGVLLALNLRGRQLFGPFLVHLHHLLLAGLGLSLLLSLLLLGDALLLSRILVRGDLCLLPHASDVGRSQHGSLSRGTLDILLDITAHLTEVIVADNGNVTV